MKSLIGFQKHSPEKDVDKVLMVEDSKFFAAMVKKRIESELKFDVTWLQTYSDAVSLIDNEKPDFLVGLLDLNLPDAPRGEIVDFVLSRNIPSIVLTGNFSDEVRDSVWAKWVVDYVLKEDSYSVDYVVSLIRRIHRNRSIKTLVVDDSITSRTLVGKLLAVHQYNVFEARDGNEAISILDANPDIKMVITDFNMPNMDGFQLTKEIRGRYKKEDIAVIGMSTQGGNNLSARFIKHGANDFIVKPFLSEEFYCRITQNIETIEHIKTIRDAATTDYLTGLFNRRYFFDAGKQLYANSQRHGLTIVTAMMDIDHFKKVNDTYGHDAGDEVIRRIARVLKDSFRQSDIVARFGGEEFCMLGVNMDRNRAFSFFDAIRLNIQNTAIPIADGAINVTVSVGVCAEPRDSLEDMIRHADARLYDAKNGGRNKVMITERSS